MSNPLLAKGTGTFDPNYPGHDWQDLNPQTPTSAERLWEIDEQLRSITAVVEAGVAVALPLELGTGDNLGYFDSSGPVAGIDMTVLAGTSTAPVTAAQPSIKISRFEDMRLAAGFSNGAVVERNSLITAIVQNVATSEVQATALTGYATSRSTKAHPTYDPDSCGVNGVGRVSAGGVGTGMGAFFEGARESNTGKITALQLQTRNLGSAVSHGTAGINDCVGIWLVAANNGAGTGQAGTGLMFGHPLGYAQFDVGIGFQSNDGGAIKTAAFWDATQALQSIRIGGAHANGAIVVESAAGSVIVGATAPQFAARLEVLSPNSTSGNPLAVFGELIGSDSQVVQFRNQSGVLRVGAAASGGFGVTGAAAGDGIVQQFTAGTSLHIAGTTAKVLTITADGKLGAFATTPVLQQGATTDLRQGLINYGFFASGGASPLNLNGGALTAGSLTLADGGNVAVGTGTGTKIGTSTSQKLGFFNAAPVARPAPYTPSNVTTDRSYNADSTTIDEVADVLGTLIADLQSLGLIG